MIDDVSCSRLLAHALPRVIENDEENERAIAVLERLDSQPTMTEDWRTC